MLYTLGQAAKATGKAKGTIKNAINKGRISATQNESGEYQIEASELHRVYSPVQNTEQLNDVTPSDLPPAKAAEIKLLEAELKHKDEKIRMLEEDRDEWRKQAQQLLLSPPKQNGLETTSLNKPFWRRLLGR